MSIAVNVPATLSPAKSEDGFVERTSACEQTLKLVQLGSSGYTGRRMNTATRRVLFLLFFLSGFASLVYQVV
jgi:hypothetical protein